MNDDGIFINETEIYNRSQKIISKGSNTPEELLQEYQQLADDYWKLLRQTKKLVYMADNTQHQLRKTNELVQDKVKELTIAEEKLKKLSITDPLTEILNRRGIFKRLNEYQIRYERSSEPFSIFIIDADHFKKINDKYGHNAGDHILKEIVTIIKSSLREQDTIGRWGGEEFILILPGTDTNGAVVLAEKVRQVIEKNQIFFNENIIPVTISLGGSNYTGDINHCLELADKALYKSKADGRNRMNFNGC